MRKKEFPNLSSLTDLHFLDLQFNQIPSLNQTKIEGLISLETLNLAGNELKSMPVLSHISITLQTLNLSHNPLEILPTGFIDSLANLQDLDLSYTLLTAIPFWSSAHNALVNLYFQGNDLECLCVDNWALDRRDVITVDRKPCQRTTLLAVMLWKDMEPSDWCGE